MDKHPFLNWKKDLNCHKCNFTKKKMIYFIPRVFCLDFFIFSGPLCPLTEKWVECKFSKLFLPFPPPPILGHFGRFFKASQHIQAASFEKSSKMGRNWEKWKNKMELPKTENRIWLTDPSLPWIKQILSSNFVQERTIPLSNTGSEG